MKIWKIILGLLLLYGGGEEYGSASRQLNTFLDPKMLLLGLIFFALGAWLIAAGFSKTGFKLKSMHTLKFTALSLVAFLLFALKGFFSAQ
ncbi:MAG: hypothetical protein GC181_14040 [Bacteroidetes bacterium]|nr:hypothetical protein [Bacteroidota bacterium]